MNQTVFLGVAAVLDAVGAFLATRQHLYPAYGCFSGAIVMVGLAVWVSYWNEYRVRRGKKTLGEVLVELSQCELAAYAGSDGSDFDSVKQRLNAVHEKIKRAAKFLDDASVESRFLAVNVHDIELTEAMKRHFLDRAQGSFWSMYQKIKASRQCVERMLGEICR